MQSPALLDKQKLNSHNVSLGFKFSLHIDVFKDALIRETWLSNSNVINAKRLYHPCVCLPLKPSRLDFLAVQMTLSD